ncbi:Glycosyl transferase family 2 [Tumidithrix helvetica PCC 7403]|uniref:glycosyltransferase n=1 Tax=Tumidithrix helvetica TaxID=3457545 RepID=UPI003CB03564
MQEAVRVAICIPTYNQSAYLEASVQSACSQTYSNIEVWVADDASTDETPSVMAKLCEQFQQINYFRQEKNLGIAGNNTWLLNQPNTEFIVRLDSDDILKPDYVEKLLQLLEKYPEAGYAHTAIQIIDELGKPHAIKRVSRKATFQNSEEALQASVYGYRVAANICMFRSKVLRELKVYENRPEFVEDYDLSIRIADAGYGNVYSDEVLAYYRVWSDIGKVRSKRKNLQLSGYIRIFEESLLPAYAKRKWDTRVITRQRQQFALTHAAYCFLPIFNETEKAELIALLKRLGDSPALRLRLFLLSLGLAPFFEWQLSAVGNLKDLAKTILSGLRNQGIKGVS